jgi:cation-transporting ATPase 13A1
MYKILALNSLVTAYGMSALYLDGVKNGDMQSTILGILIAILFMMISFSSPIKTLDPMKPPSNIFHPSLVVSMLI